MVQKWTSKAELLNYGFFLLELAMICMEDIFISQNEEQRRQEEQLQ